MSYIELFSKRQKRERQTEQEDFYQYDNLPEGFRVQVIYILKESIGGRDNEYWKALRDAFAREKGVFSLSTNPYKTQADSDECCEYILNAKTMDVLDLIELCFKVIDGAIKSLSPYQLPGLYITQDAESAVTELNIRFKEHSIGYEFINGNLMRIDSQYIHKEIMKDSINLLYNNKFSGAIDEFSKAHKYYREDKYKESMVEALKAFESTMKSICVEKRWKYNSTDTAAKLIDVLFKEELIPQYLQSQFTALIQCLKCGTPTVRNKTSGHGQGIDVIPVPEYLNAYVLHMTATNIVFLVKAFEASLK